MTLPQSNDPRRRSTRRRASHGLTLVEMLVALAVTLIMMGAVISVFGFIGERVTDSRSIIETNDRLRAAAHRLRLDLNSLTCDVVPWQRPEENVGYFEVLEGKNRDFHQDDPATPINESTTIEGDVDDLLLFTARTSAEPFRGKFANTYIESNVAEIAWFLRWTNTVGGQDVYSLCRRVMLIDPSRSLNYTGTHQEFYDSYDFSARPDTAMPPKWTPNTLGDVTKVENRFLHSNPVNAATAFPWHIRQSLIQVDDFTTRSGEDVVLSNVVAFDVQVWDPDASLRMNTATNTILSPGDPGYTATTGTTPAGLNGGYVDLNFTNASSSSTSGTSLSGAPHAKWAVGTPRMTAYDTWSFHYEHNGINEDQAADEMTPQTDEGTDGMDNDGANGIDDVDERETSPPYPIPLRGIRVKIRVYEPSSKQVREVSIVQSFVK